MASDEHVATALRAFADALMQGTRNGGAGGGALSEEQKIERRKGLKGLSERVQARAANPNAATWASKMFGRKLRN